MLRSRVLLSAFVLAAFSPSARAEEDVAAKVAQLNKRAMEDYDLLEFEAAKKTLTEAVSLLKKAGLESDPAAAKTYLNLGIVYVGGLKDRYKGFQQFVKALQVKADSKLDPSLATPELQEVFDNARDTVGVPKGGGKVTQKTPPIETQKTPPVEVAPPTPVDGTSDDIKGLVHKTVDEAPIGQPIPIKAQVGSDVAASRLFLFYRTPDREDYATVPMTKNKKGVYTGMIPGEAVQGKSLQYYIEARDSRGKPLIGNGSPSSPNIITVAAAGTVVPQDPGDTENPLATQQVSRRDTEIKRNVEPESGGRHEVWLTVGAGTGFGIATGNADLQSKVPIATGFAPAYVHLIPEIGFFVAERWALSVQGRLQILTNADSMSTATNCTATGNYVCGQPATGGIVVLGRLMYFFSRDHFRGFADFAAGGGQLRHTVDIGTALGAGHDGATDTVNSGPVFFGPGLGFHYDFSDRVGLVGELQSLIGVDQFTANLDFNLGFAFNL